MSKKSFPFVLLMIFVMSGLLSSCGPEPIDPPAPAPHPTSLAAPTNLVFDAKSLTFNWSPVDKATGYQCAVGSIFDLVQNATAISTTKAVIVNPVKDVWETFLLRAVYSSGGYQITSDAVSLDYIVTDKIILESPKDFTYDITNRADDVVSLEVRWKQISNAGSYSVYVSVTTPDGVTLGSQKLFLSNMVAVPNVKIGSTVLVSVVAMPVAGSPDYISSRKGAAQIKEIK